MRQFVKPAACLYGKKDVDALREQVKPLVDKGDVVIITAHGPPRGKGKQAIDYAIRAARAGHRQGLFSAAKSARVSSKSASRYSRSRRRRRPPRT